MRNVHYSIQIIVFRRLQLKIIESLFCLKSLQIQVSYEDLALAVDGEDAVVVDDDDIDDLDGGDGLRYELMKNEQNIARTKRA